jgi:hypothetical protein
MRPASAIAERMSAHGALQVIVVGGNYVDKEQVPAAVLADEESGG